MRRIRLLSGSVIFHFVILSFLLTCVIPPGAWAMPTITITNPDVDGEGNATVWGETTVDVAYRGDRGAKVIKIILYVDGSPRKEIKLNPPQAQGQLSFPFDFNLATGQTHVIAAKAIDATGGENSITVNVRVQKAGVGGSAADKMPPTIRIFYPAHGTQVDGIIRLKAEGQDNIGITSVVFYVDGKLHTMLVNAPPWETELNSRKLADGLHTIGASAADAAGNEGRSAEITIIVQNKPLPLPGMPTTIENGGEPGTIVVGGPGGTQPGSETPPVIDYPQPTPAFTSLPGEAAPAPRFSDSAGMLIASAPMGLAGIDAGYRIATPERAVAGTFLPGAPGLTAVTPPSPIITPLPTHVGPGPALPRVTTPPVGPRTSTPGGHLASGPGLTAPSATGPGLTPARTATPPSQVAYRSPATSTVAPSTAAVASSSDMVEMLRDPLQFAGSAPLAPARTVVPSGETSVAMLTPVPATTVPGGVGAAATPSYGAQTAWDPAGGTPALTICPALNGRPPEETGVAMATSFTPVPTAVPPALGVATMTSGLGLQPTATPSPGATLSGRRIGIPERVALTPRMQAPPASAATGHESAISDNVPAAIAHIRNIKVVFNGQQLDLRTLPAMQQGISMTPLREVFEHTNGVLYWYPQEKRVEAKSDQMNVKLQIGNPQAQVNGEAQTLSLAPYIKQGRTMVPLQFVADTLNVTITFNPDTGQIVISSNEF